MPDMENMAFTLAETMVTAAGNTSLRIGSGKAPGSTALILGEKQLGQSFNDYAATVRQQGETQTLRDMTNGMVMPLRERCPDAYSAGIAYMQTQARLFGERENAWAHYLPPKGPR